MTARQDFADKCLRQLGGGVINIEVSPDQIEDNIGLAIQKYQEYHFDGIERGYISKKVAATVITVADTTGLAVGDILTGQTTKSTAVITALTSTKITIGKISGFDKFAVAEVLSNGVTSVTITAIILGEIDSGYLTVTDDVVGVIRVLNLTNVISSGDVLFNPQYQIMMQEISNLTSGQASYFYGAMNYLSHLDFILRKEKDFRFNRRMNRVFLDINWGIDFKIDDVVTVEVYKALEPETYTEVYSDRWLIEYCTALLMRQWATNLGKYDNVQLPGGVQYNADRLFQRADAAIQKLEDEAINSSAPLSFCVG